MISDILVAFIASVRLIRVWTIEIFQQDDTQSPNIRHFWIVKPVLSNEQMQGYARSAVIELTSVFSGDEYSAVPPLDPTKD
jgi:hypothetical protein